MSRDYLLYLEDMQVSCKKLLRYAEGLDFDQFVADEKTYDAAIFNLVIVLNLRNDTYLAEKLIA